MKTLIVAIILLMGFGLQAQRDTLVLSRDGDKYKLTSISKAGDEENTSSKTFDTEEELQNHLVSAYNTILLADVSYNRTRAVKGSYDRMGDMILGIVKDLGHDKDWIVKPIDDVMNQSNPLKGVWFLSYPEGTHLVTVNSGQVVEIDKEGQLIDGGLKASYRYISTASIELQIEGGRTDILYLSENGSVMFNIDEKISAALIRKIE